jgi:hypothetical protein
MLLNWLRQLSAAKNPSRPRPSSRGTSLRAASFKPALEALEDRQVLSPVVTAAAGISGSLQSYVQPPGGGLDLYSGGAYQSTIVDPTYASSQGGIAQVSAGEHGPQGWLGAPSSAFVRFGNNSVIEYYQFSGLFWINDTICQAGSGASEISAVQNQSDDVFVRFGNGVVAEHIGPELNAGWNPVVVPNPLNAYAPYASFGASQISAGKDAVTGKDAVFVNFSGSLWENSGSAFGSGWKYVTSNVTSLSASQMQGDTVFVVKSGALSEYVNGLGSGTIANNVAQVSTGIDSSVHAAAFILDTSGHLSESKHTGTNLSTGWTTTFITGNVTEIDAAQENPDTVYYVQGQFGSDWYWIYQHSGTNNTLIYELHLQ